MIPPPKSIHWKDPGDEGRNKLRFLIAVENLYGMQHSFTRLYQLGHGGAIIHQSNQIWFDNEGNAFYCEDFPYGSE